jgi:hypothetical protein
MENWWCSLVALREYTIETPEWPEDPPDNWLTYHLAHPGPGKADPGDPNPAFFYKGWYHLHYIYNSKYGFSNAHVSSKDMVHWKWHPTVLTPPITRHGMFSGTGFFTKEGHPAMIYHGVGSRTARLAIRDLTWIDDWPVAGEKNFFNYQVSNHLVVNEQVCSIIKRRRLIMVKKWILPFILCVGVLS